MQQIPFVFRCLAVVFLLVLIFWSIEAAQDFLIPICIAGLLAMLLLPIARKLERLGVHRAMSSLFCIIFGMVVLSLVIFLLYSQLMSFAQDLPSLEKAVMDKIEKVQNYITSKTGITDEKQMIFAREKSSGFLNSSGTYITSTLSTTTSFLAKFLIQPIYIFFFLFYRGKFRSFIEMVLKKSNIEKSEIIVDKVQTVSQAYLGGVFLVVIVLSVLNSVGLLIIGIEHAVFFGVLAALLNIIPYIGVMIGSILPIIMAFITKDDLAYPLSVWALFMFNQFLENNFITPNIVGSKVNVNPLATIMALIVGGMLWGVPGMVLFIPFIGILKVIFDHVDSLKPIGFLIGEEGNEQYALSFARIKAFFSRFKK